MIPAVANGVPVVCVRPSDGNVKNAVLVSTLPVTCNGFAAVAATPCAALVDGATTVVTVTGLVTALWKVNGVAMAVVGSILTLPSGHVGPLLPAHGAGPLYSVL